MKLCLVSSAGGHLDQILQLEPVLQEYDYFFIINDRKPLRKDVLQKAYFITQSQRDLNFFVNLLESFRILLLEKPSVIISTGAGCAVPVSLVGKYIFNCKIIYIETFARVIMPTLTARVMYFIADLFIYQWKFLERFFPKGVYGGPIF